MASAVFHPRFSRHRWALSIAVMAAVLLIDLVLMLGLDIRRVKAVVISPSGSS